jgi:hypothetical protein
MPNIGPVCPAIHRDAQWQLELVMRALRKFVAEASEGRVEIAHQVRDAEFGGRGRRTPATLLALDERDRCLIEAACHFPGFSDREIARRLRSLLLIYRQGAWRRDRVDALCPPRHAGRLEAVLWMLLKVRDAIPSERTIRAVLSRTEY